MYPIDSFVFCCFMITCCVFGAIKFCQLEVQCNFPVYLTSCIKYKLILLWHPLNFCSSVGFFKNQSCNFFFWLIWRLPSARNFYHYHLVSYVVWYIFIGESFFQPFVFFSYLTIIIFFMLVLIFRKVFMYQVRHILCS